MAQISNLKPSGLATFMNYLSKVPDGALLDATNVVIDRDGIIEPRRGITAYGDIGTLGSRVNQLLTYKDRILAHFDNSTIAYDTGTTDAFGKEIFNDFTGTFAPVQTGVRVKGVELNGNFYVTTALGIKKICSSTNDLSTAKISNSGGIKALDCQASIDYSTAGFFLGYSKVAYRIVWGTKDVNTNLILGSPSNRVVLTNYSTSSANVNLSFTVPNAVNTDYFYQIYRTSVLTADPFTVTILNSIDPGDEMRLVYEAPVTTDQISSKQVTVRDITPEAFQQGGVYLYTNPTTGDGITQANEPPPAALDIAVFKNTVFFANTRTIQSLSLNLLGLGNIEKGDITNSSLVSTTLTITSAAHGLSDNQLVAIVIPESDIGFLPADVNPSIDVITINGHGLDDGQVIQFKSTGTLPAGLALNTDYYVINATTNTFKVSTSLSGTAVDITTTGSGVHKIASFGINNIYQIGNVSTNTFDIVAPANTIVNDYNSASWFASNIKISNGTATNQYFFVGAPEVTTATFDTVANTTDGSWFELSSAENLVRYSVWFKKTSAQSGPSANGNILIEVPLVDKSFGPGAVSISADTITYSGHGYQNSDVIEFYTSGTLPAGLTAATTYYIVNETPNSFQVALTPGGAVVDITSAGTGTFFIQDSFSVITADDLAAATSKAILAASADFDISTASNVLTISTTTNGFAKNSAIGSTAPGGAFALITNQNGYGENSVKNFVRLSGYISAGQAIDDTTQSLVKVINKNIDEIVYAYYISGVTDVPGLMNFSSRTIANQAFTIIANDSSTGALFSPDLTTTATSSDEERANRLYFSKKQQPEAVPSTNNLDIGPKDKAIRRIVPLRDSLFIFKDDGIYRLTGDNANNFSVLLFDNSVRLNAPDTASVLNNQIYCLTDGGVATVTETGVGIVSRPIEDSFRNLNTNYPNFSTASFGVGYETDRSYLVWTVTSQDDTAATQCFRFNTFTQAWTRWDRPQTAAVINQKESKLYVGGGNSNSIEVERKSLTRNDYADDEFDLSITPNAIIDTTSFTISSAADLALGDALVQTQYVTIAQFNNLLLKLDADPRVGMAGLPFTTDYYATLQMRVGNSLSNKMTLLINKLNSDPGVASVYSFSGASDFATIQTEYNAMIAEMNLDAKLKFSNYKPSSGTVAIEMTITDLNKNASKVTGDAVPAIMVGPITAFKGINTSVIWAPTSMGDPSMMKHVREATMMFESTGFRGGEIAYNTDLSPGFEAIAFKMDGNGSWGGFEWGNTAWGGNGTSAPLRTYIPRQMQRCRFIRTRFKHSDAFYKFSIMGTSFTFEANSERAYRGKS